MENFANIDSVTIFIFFGLGLTSGASFALMRKLLSNINED